MPSEEDTQLIKFITSVEWPKYIQDKEVNSLVVSLRDKIKDLSGADGEEEDEDVDVSGAIRVKLVVVGDGAVGKTSLLISYATAEFPTDYVPTVFENYTAKKKRGSDNILLHLWDTAGQEEYDRLRPLSYPGADVVLLCFSTVSQASYEAIKDKWAPEVHHYIPSVPHILVGTKVDLRAEEYPDPNSGEFEPVTEEMGKEMAKQIKAERYLECSAKTTEGLDKVFDAAIGLVLESREQDNPTGPDSESETGSSPSSKHSQKNRCVVL